MQLIKSNRDPKERRKDELLVCFSPKSVFVATMFNILCYFSKWMNILMKSSLNLRKVRSSGKWEEPWKVWHGLWGWSSRSATSLNFWLRTHDPGLWGRREGNLFWESCKGETWAYWFTQQQCVCGCRIKGDGLWSSWSHMGKISHLTMISVCSLWNFNSPLKIAVVSNHKL